MGDHSLRIKPVLNPRVRHDSLPRQLASNPVPRENRRRIAGRDSNPCADHLRVVEFEQDRSITVRIIERGRASRVFGSVAVTYAAVEGTDGGTRLLAKLSVHRSRGLIAFAMRLVLPWGDLVMMRRQLLNLKRLAESSG